MPTRHLFALLAAASLVLGVGCAPAGQRVVQEQAHIGDYDDVVRADLEFTAQREATVRAVEIALWRHGRRDAPRHATGSPVMVVLGEAEHMTLLGYGILPRAAVPDPPGGWARVELQSPVRLTAGRAYALAVISLNRGGEDGWSEYARGLPSLAPGDPMPDRTAYDYRDLTLSHRLLE